MTPFSSTADLLVCAVGGTIFLGLLWHSFKLFIARACALARSPADGQRYTPGTVSFVFMRSLIRLFFFAVTSAVLELAPSPSTDLTDYIVMGLFVLFVLRVVDAVILVVIRQRALTRVGRA
jgi:hypothetical protein